MGAGEKNQLLNNLQQVKYSKNSHYCQALKAKSERFPVRFLRKFVFYLDSFRYCSLSAEYLSLVALPPRKCRSALFFESTFFTFP